MGATMIVSHRHRFAFLHCRKAAGTSITIYLTRFLGPLDLHVGGSDGNRETGQPRNLRHHLDAIRYRFGRPFMAELVRAAAGRRRPDLDPIHRAVHRASFGPQPGHASSADLRRVLGPRFDAYFTFCFVRNPFDRVFSDYVWRLRRRGIDRSEITFLEFLLRYSDPGRPDPEGLIPSVTDNWPIYTVDDRIDVDFVGRYETLHTDMATVCERIGLPYDPAAFPHTKKAPDHGRDYRRHYGEMERAIVTRLCGRELETFGYAF
jgi:hypothetical protein